MAKQPKKKPKSPLEKYSSKAAKMKHEKAESPAKKKKEIKLYGKS